LHIVQFFDGVIPPPTYGGIERVVFWLTREFVKNGHRVTVVAHPNSRIVERLPDVTLVPLHPGNKDYQDLIPNDAEVIHFHNVPPIGNQPDKPFIVTEHGNRKRFRGYWPNTVFLSKSHAKNHHGSVYVYNGIPKEDYPLNPEKLDYMLYMAKLDWRAKNAKTAINLSLDTGIALKLTGGNLWRSRKVWGLWLLRGLLKLDLLHNEGGVGGRRKLDLLQKARVLFYLINWHEPFGLAPHEALACGTPVLASPNGALAEYIDNGKNGFLVSDYKEACAALERLRDMSASETRHMAEYCRTSARSITDSAQAYLAMYETVIERGELYPPEDAKHIWFDPPHSKIIKR
jgi:glycosyltransferase involved in cell wall biosynthesis